ncbi:MAG: hypothetical protein A2511_04810 [Deltaproteobacteria bacterium RIFOXYD12_FULL_50_9]|nr:MAG: hypothetical protein A2511_04810 [Deltaproteobacteria bacterium RIFOXYD12_FULL_50_9]
MSKKVCFLFANSAYMYDGMRSALGLSVANHFSNGAVLNGLVLPPFDDYNKENLEWIRDMEGDMFSVVPENCEVNAMTPVTIEELGAKLREMDVVVPYGIMRPEKKS